MCIKAVEVDPWQLYHVPDHFKTQEICDVAVREDPSSLTYVPYWFITQQQIGLWGDDEVNEWHNGYRKRKAQKAKIKEELIPISPHSSRWRD